jgi:hypothetical protein
MSGLSGVRLVTYVATSESVEIINKSGEMCYVLEYVVRAIVQFQFCMLHGS